MALSGTRTRQVNCMLLSKDEATLYTGDSGHSVIAWELATGERKATMKADDWVRAPLQ